MRSTVANVITNLINLAKLNQREDLLLNLAIRQVKTQRIAFQRGQPAAEAAHRMSTTFLPRNHAPMPIAYVDTARDFKKQVREKRSLQSKLPIWLIRLHSFEPGLIGWHS